MFLSAFSLLILVFAPAGAGAAKMTPTGQLSITALSSPDPVPGSFATLGYRLENFALEEARLRVTIVPPSRWTPVSASLDLHVKPGRASSVPFTLWIPTDASSDTLYKVLVLVHDGDELASAGERLVHVAEFRKLIIRALTVDPADGFGAPAETGAAPGQEARHRFRVTNLGNSRVDADLRSESVPNWKTTLRPSRLVLAPGESAVVEAIVSVPRSASPGTIHLLRLFTDTAREQVTCKVRPGREAAGRSPRLPLSAELSLGEVQPGAPAQAVRVGSGGIVSPGVRLDLEAEALHDEDRAWRTRRAQARMHAGSWDLSVGDVTREFPDLAAQTVFGRGVSAQTQADSLRLRFFAGKDPDRPGTAYWGAGVDEALGRRVRLGGDFLLHDEPGSTGARRTALSCLSSVVRPGGELRCRFEAAWSRSIQDKVAASQGEAAQLFLDRVGRRFQLRARGYAGTAGFGGRTRDRDGASVFGLVVPRSPIRLWVDAEVSRGRAWEAESSPVREMRRFRTGGRYARSLWPAIELIAGGVSERTVPQLTRRTERRDATLTATQSIGSFTCAASGRVGRAWERGRADAGAIGGVDLSLGGQIGRLRSLLRWIDDRDWLPASREHSRNTSMAGELTWTSRSQGIQGGVGVSSRRIRPGSSAEAHDWSLLPRLDLRLIAGLRLRCEGAWLSRGSRPQLDQWQVQLAYASSDAVPLLWMAVRGGMRGVVFVDSDEDDAVDPGEQRIAGVVLYLDGRRMVSDEKGCFDWPVLDPGAYRLELDRNSLPTRMVCRKILPIEVRIEKGGSVLVTVPLAADGEIRGRVYKEVGGAADIRMVLLGPSGQVAECLTGLDGSYRFPQVLPGTYEVRLADGWLPPDWVSTPSGTQKAVVGPGERIDLPPVRIAPREKPNPDDLLAERRRNRLDGRSAGITSGRLVHTPGDRSTESAESSRLNRPASTQPRQPPRSVHRPLLEVGHAGLSLRISFSTSARARSICGSRPAA